MTDDAVVSLDLIRRQVAALLSQINTATLPHPDKANPKRHKRHGHEWNPGKGWRVFTLDDPDHGGFVYVDHACDDISYGWGEPGDWECMRIEDARRIGLAFLAAAERAESQLATRPVRLAAVPKR